MIEKSDNKYNVELIGFPPSLGNNKCYDCGVLKEDLKQDSYWEKYVIYQDTPMSVFQCDACEAKPTLICPICKWVGNEGKASMKIISDITAEPGYCPKCSKSGIITKCLKFDD